jgi:dihydroorotase
MKILVQGAEIVDSSTPYHRKEKNVLIQNGKIIAIGDKSLQADKVINAQGMKLTPGWFDLGTYVGDPGLEQKEDLDSVIKTAAAGGFTEIAVLPNTHPAIQTKNEVSYIGRGNSTRLVLVHALAAITRDCKGEELTEMIDLNDAGAIGFTDGLKPVWHTDILLKSLQYLQKFDGILIDTPEDPLLNIFGQMNEGIQSTMLGLKGMPRIAEEIVISRNLELLGYAGGRLHFAKLSAAKSMDLIRAAKKKQNVSCNITSYQALLDDSMVAEFNTSFKVNPPLREKADAEALIKGLKDGTIDVICSGHVPQDEESKNVEFDLADFGMISLQTFASNIVSLSKWVDYEMLIEKITVAPRKLLKMEIPKIEVDEKANLTLLDPDRVWTLNEKTNFSKSNNSPWWNKQLVGKVAAVFNNGKYWIDNLKDIEKITTG